MDAQSERQRDLREERERGEHFTQVRGKRRGRRRRRRERGTEVNLKWSHQRMRERSQESNRLSKMVSMDTEVIRVTATVTSTLREREEGGCTGTVPERHGAAGGNICDSQKYKSCV